MIVFFSIAFLDTIYFPRASDGSQRYRCDSNSSIFVYNPQTRRVHLVSNQHCIVVNRNSYHYLATEDYPTVNVLKSIACERTSTGSPTSYLIWSTEFRLVHDRINNEEASLRFISPTDGHEYIIYIRGNILIVVDKDDPARKVLDQLREPTLEIVKNFTYAY